MTLSSIKKVAIIILFFCAVSISLLSPIRDNDFFWHLATGKWIAEHRELPTIDPFAYTTSLKAQEDFFRAKILMTQYWLANLLQYGVFSFGGYYGIIVLRVIIIIATLLILALHMRKKGLNAVSSILLLVPLFFVFSLYKGDRPNQMTYLFAALFMFLADALKRGEKKGYLLPLVLLIWANVHGGFLLGAAIAAILVVAELIRKMSLKDYVTNKRLVTVMLVTLGVGVLNPNGYTLLYSTLFETSAYYSATIAEARTPWSFTMSGVFIYMWMLGISLFVAVWYGISRVLLSYSRPGEAVLYLCDELLIVLFLAILSCMSIRYIPLLVLVLLPVTAPLFARRFQYALQKLSAYFVPELLIVAVSVWWIYGSYSHTVLKLSPIALYYPDDAVRFIRDNEMKGRFYNYYDWGGYLIWQFYPEQPVFIDSRALDLKVYNEYDMIISGRQDMFAGNPLYKSLLDSYSVRHLIIPALDMEGSMVKLMRALEFDHEWHLIFVGRNSLIFTRDPVEQEYPKSLSYAVAISGAMEIINRFPGSVYAYLTFAKANSYLGRRTIAIKGLEEALKKRPSLRGGSVEKALLLLKEGREIPTTLQ